jgi:hypothetical protein
MPNGTGEKITAEEFALRIKAKYPQYKDVPNGILASRVLQKYPQYREMVTLKEAISPLPAVPGLFSGGGQIGPEIAPGQRGTIAAGESLPHAVGRQAIAGVGRAAENIATAPYQLAKGIYESPHTLGIKPTVIDPMQQEAAKARQEFAAGHPGWGTVHAAASGIPVVGPLAGSILERARTGDTGAITEALTYLLIPEAERKGKTGYREFRSRGAAPRAVEALKSATTGVTPDFGPHLERTITVSGDLPEIARQYKPKTYREAYNAVSKYADALHKNVVQAAVKAFPAETIPGDALASAVEKLKTPMLQEFFPREVKVLEGEAARYAGKLIYLPDALDLLEKFNAAQNRLRQALPSSIAAAERNQIGVAAFGEAADALRKTLYGKLESLGVADIAEFQKDYGALKDIRDAMWKNIVRSERIGEGPKLLSWKSAGRMITRRPWLTGSMLLGSEYFRNPELLLTLPAVEAIQIGLERGRVPNAVLQKAFEDLARVKTPLRPRPVIPLAGAAGRPPGAPPTTPGQPPMAARPVPAATVTGAQVIRPRGLPPGAGSQTPPAPPAPAGTLGPPPGAPKPTAEDYRLRDLMLGKTRAA